MLLTASHQKIVFLFVFFIPKNKDSIGGTIVNGTEGKLKQNLLPFNQNEMSDTFYYLAFMV